MAIGIDETKRREFESAWIARKPLAIEDCLPPPTDGDYLATLEELIHIDLEFRWKLRSTIRDQSSESATTVEDYLRRFPQLHDDCPRLLRLIQQEHWARWKYGDQPAANDYRRRFPDLLSAYDAVTELFQKVTPATPANDFTGQSLGRYLVKQKHAEGGCGEIWLAYDSVLRRDVALKTLYPTLVRDEEFRQRFIAEARTTAALEHPGIVAVHDLNDAQADHPYYTMRLLGGETLADAIDRHHAEIHVGREQRSTKNVERRRLLSAFLAVARTVEFAHAQGVIHRDLKPQNIILGEYGETAILDWGLAKLRDEQPVSPVPEASDHLAGGDFLATRQGTVLGTPAYMSPEQAAGEIDQIDERSDQYCLGAILYHLLTGEPPFQSTRDVHERRHIRPPREVYRDTAPALEAICLKALAYRPADRYRTVGELNQDIERFLADEPTDAFPEPWMTRAARWVQRHRPLIAAAITAAAVGAVLLTIGYLMALDNNRELSRREQEANLLRVSAQDALAQANANLYVQQVNLAHAEVMQNNVVRAEELLHACPPELRDWEWHHVNWLIQKDKPTINVGSRGEPIYDVSISAEGSKYATAYADGNVTIWDARTLAAEHVLPHGQLANVAVFSPSGKSLVTGGSQTGMLLGSVRLWDVGTGRLIASAAAHGKSTFAATFLDEQTLVTGGHDRHITVWRLPDLKQMKTWRAHNKSVRSLEIGRLPEDEARLVFSCAHDGRVKMWDATTWELVNSWGKDEDQRRLYQVSLGPDGRWLASAGGDRSVRIWDARTKAEKSLLLGHTDQVVSVAFAPRQDLIASAGFDRTVRLWTTSGRPLEVIRGNTSHIRSVAFTPDGERLLVGGDDGAFRIWSTERFATLRPIARILRFSPTTASLALGDGRSDGIWDLGARQSQVAFDNEGSSVAALSYAPSGEAIAVAYHSGQVTVYDTLSGKRLFRQENRGEDCLAAAFSNDSTRLAVGFTHGNLRIYDADSGAFQQTIVTEGVPYRLAFLKGDAVIVSGHTDGQLCWWDVDSGTERCRQSAHHKLFDLELNPGGEWIATTGADGWVRIWDAETGAGLQSLKVGSSWMNCVSFTPDGRRLASGSEHTVTFWDTATWREILSMTLDRCIHDMSFSHDGRYLAVTGEDLGVRLWQGALAGAPPIGER